MVDDPSVDPQNDLEVVEGSTALAPTRLVPTVCTTQAWSSDLVSISGVSVSVASSGNRATAIATPSGGGELVGLMLDPGHARMSSHKVELDGYTQVIASVVGSRLAAAAISNAGVDLHLLDEDFTNPQHVAKLAGTTVAQPAIYNLGDELVMPTLSNDGVWLHRFQDSFEPIASRHIATSKPAHSLSAAQVGIDLLAAWSTDDGCTVLRTNGDEPDFEANLAVECKDPRVALDPATGRGAMVFTSSDGVRVTALYDAKLGPTGLMRAGATSPRVLFDGKRTWVSFLDERGDIIVGFVHGNQLLSMSLSGPKPHAGAYDLVMVNGVPWVFSLDEDGYAGYHMCIETL
jgi:hypothetical protein